MAQTKTHFLNPSVFQVVAYSHALRSRILGEVACLTEQLEIVKHSKQLTCSRAGASALSTPLGSLHSTTTPGPFLNGQNKYLPFNSSSLSSTPIIDPPSSKGLPKASTPGDNDLDDALSNLKLQLHSLNVTSTSSPDLESCNSAQRQPLFSEASQHSRGGYSAGSRPGMQLPQLPLDLQKLTTCGGHGLSPSDFSHLPPTLQQFAPPSLLKGNLYTH